MVKICKVLILFIVAVTLISACGKPSDEEIYYDAHKKMMGIKSYETTARIYSHIGGTKREYEFNQIFMYPDKYRLEVISPKSIEGNVTIFNGKTAWIEHAAINQTWKMDNFQQSKEQLMFIGYFLQNFINSENSTYHSESLEGRETIVITTELPGGNPHFHSQKLWMDRKDLTPIKLTIVDHSDKPRFEVYYEDFKINPDLEESLFYLDQN